jgi:hypothetical protein
MRRSIRAARFDRALRTEGFVQACIWGINPFDRGASSSAKDGDGDARKLQAAEAMPHCQHRRNDPSLVHDDVTRRAFLEGAYQHWAIFCKLPAGSPGDE